MTPALAQAGGFGQLETWFVRLLDTATTPAFAVVAVLSAVAIGAAHALAPGHGKAIAAAYLVGARGRARDAAALGGIVAGMHTASVLVLGLLLFQIARTPATGEQLGPWMTLASGLLVLGVGAGLLRRNLRRRTAAPALVGGHGHDHDHGVPHTHTPTLPDGVSPLSRRGLWILGASGGLLPSPSAFLVLATGLFSGRTAFALTLVAAFSLGLAVSLTAIGLVVLKGRDLLTRRAHAGRLRWLSANAPLAGAVGVVLGGLVVTAGAALRLLGS
jgi:nickel/cobalt transporter (NicO) family protein